MSTNLNETNQCPSCGQPIPVGLLAGLCPACLFAQGADTEQAQTKARVRFEPPKLAEISRLFPQLQVLELLGAGGMGAVYKARQPALDRLVALKVLPAGGGVGSTERFNREARALARLSHPNIVGVHEFGQVEGLHFFIMEFVDGANLRQLEKTARLSPREALQIIPQICDALQYAHDEGVVHRDIKPENVLVDRRGRVKIADFGLAKIADPDPEATRLTVEGQVMGTPHYMAPEQVERPLAVDHRADIYALGVVFYEMLTGDLPLGKFAPPSRKVKLDVRLDDIVLRALENDPERRYQQASEVKQSVATVVDSPGAEAGAPAGSSVTAEQYVRWLGIPVAVERNGVREVNFQGAMAATFVVMMCAAAAHMFVRWAAGREHALSAWVVLAGLVTIVFGIRQAMNQPREDDKGVAGRQVARDALWLAGMVAFIVGSHYGMANWMDARRDARGKVPAQVAKIVSASGTLAAALPNGTTIELLGLANGNAAPNQWWRPDGTPMPNTILDIQGPAEMQDNDRPHTKFAFKVNGSMRAMETATYEFEPSVGISAGGEVWENGGKVAGGWPIVAAWAYVTNQATLRFGLCFDTWRNIAVFTPDKPSLTETLTMAGDPKWIANLNHYSDDGSNTLVTAVLNNDMKDWRMRIVAVDSEGKEHPYSRGSGTPMEDSATWTCTFPNLTVDRIRQFNVQVQPVHWVEFRNVALSGDHPLPEAKQATQRATFNAATGVMSARLPGNGALELLAISDSAAVPGTWWRPDGGRLTNEAFQVSGLLDGATPTNVVRRDFAFRIVGNPPGIDAPVFDCDPAINPSFGGIVRENGRAIAGGWAMRDIWAPDTRSATLRMGYGLGPWRTVLAYNPTIQTSDPRSSTTDPDWMASIFDVGATNGGLQVTASLGPESLAFLDGTDRSLTISPGRHAWNWRLRLVVVDRAGTEHEHSWVESRPVPESEPWQSMLWQFQFVGLSRAATSEVRIQVQPLRWVEFRNVALQPASALPATGPQHTNLTFGPVREITFDELLDLDTGRTAAFPPGKPGENPLAGIGESVLWAQENGFDVVAEAGMLGVLNLELVKLQDSDWDALSPELIMNRLLHLSPYRERHLELREGEFPVNFAFRTREKAVGILQLAPVSDAGAGARVRYKLALAPGTDGHE